ncbi:MAG: calcium-binding protein [Leptolyngbyaceae cyanobacterium bins.349]|nr:calcium-binding protein [Leptolyngbyaceae cyanobacterium bins.349]
MQITTGNSNDIVIRPVFDAQGRIIRSNDTIRTNGGNDTINPGLGGYETVDGGDGFDHLIIDYSIGDTGGRMTFSSGPSSALVRRYPTGTSFWIDEVSAYSIEQYTVTGTRGDDDFQLRTTNHTIRAGAGNDSVRVYYPIAGNIGTIDGGTGIDYLSLNLSNQTANLTITNLLNINLAGVINATNFERFYLTTGSGNDTIRQSGIVNGSVFRANDTFDTRDGNDTINAGLGIDQVFAGNGVDHLIVDYSVGDTGSGMQFNGGWGLAWRTVSSTNTTILDEVKFGGVERFTVIGTSKNDTISTVAGNDIINAGAGNDLISGGAGGDTLTGGLGADTFQYQSYSDSLLSNFDVIKDLAIGVDAIDGPRAVAATQIRKLGYVSNLTETAIQQVLTSTNFVANGASTFRLRNGLSDRTFLALNDGWAGFSASTDSIIEITGFTGNLNSLSIV